MVDNDRTQPYLLTIFQQLEQFYMVSRISFDGFITYTNEKFLSVSNWTPKRIIGKTFWQMFPDNDDAQHLANKIWKTIESGKIWSGEVEKLSRTNEPYYTKMIAIPIMPNHGLVESVTVIETDITKDVELRNQLAHFAYYDDETGLMSRHHLEVKVNELIDSQENFAFVYLSIDHFYMMRGLQTDQSRKQVIDDFINSMKRYFKPGDIARVGVHEFVVLTPFADWFIEGFNDFLQQHPIYVEQSATPLTVTGGIIHYPKHEKTFSTLFETARDMVQNAMQSGRAQMVSVSPQLQQKNRRQSLIRQLLTEAIENEQLQTVFQPQVDANSGKIASYECLVRWNDEQLNHVAPNEFLPIAEESGHIEQISDFVFREAARLAAKLHASGHSATVSVNLSIREFINSQRTDEILAILESEHCPPSLIELEITEQFAFKAEEEASISKQMLKLQDAGMQFTLDDFGTGYASFRYLQTLPITKLKIDHLFIQSITTHEQTKQLVNGMIQFAKSLNKMIIAEGVETEEQATLLTSLGIDALEGYFVGHGMTATEIEQHLMD